MIPLVFSTLCLGFTLPEPTDARVAFLRDGDRVVMIGSTLIEREQKYGSWELALMQQNPGKRFTVRNLGWSGDTVWGESRNGFDASPKGYQRLIELTKQLKPTVIVIAYGQNESFDGSAGVAEFAKQYEKLINDLVLPGCRVVLVTPTAFEAHSLMKNVTDRNQQLEQYVNAIIQLGKKKELPVVDLFRRMREADDFCATEQDTAKKTHAWTDNGIHLNAHGYQRTAELIFESSPNQKIETKLRPELEQLRKAIVAKNELFFHSWRPQNETYLFGFRKHEQGKNAAEVAAFNPLVSQAEENIFDLARQVFTPPSK